jgi:hypothetical protein
MTLGVTEQMAFLIILIMGITEGVKKAFGKWVIDRNWLVMGIAGGLGLAAGFWLLDGTVQDRIINGVMMALAANGLYDYAKPVGIKKELP